MPDDEEAVVESPVTALAADPETETTDRDVSDDAPPPPAHTPIDDQKLQRLVDNVSDALRALPRYFASKTNIEGLGAFDLFSLNSVLGGTIEVQTVETLNRIREVWDPNEEWPEWGFERASQSFPDVRLIRRTVTGPETAMGIELKGWYLLSKEKLPSFRYGATPAACAPQDLIVVVPWHLHNVLAGVPQVYEPYIEQARYAAEMRNYYWQWQRGVRGRAAAVDPPAGHIEPYGQPRAAISDKPARDSGGNFGRLARVHGLMADYAVARLATPIAGIPAGHWISFVKAYTDAADPGEVDRRVEEMLQRGPRKLAEAEAARVVELVYEIVGLLERRT